MNVLRSISFLLCTVTFSGCMILPMPHRRLHAFGVQGSVVDSASKKAISGATVRATGAFPGICYSDPNGRFSLPPVYGLHGALLISPAIGFSMFPSLDAIDFHRDISISAHEHQEKPYSIGGEGKPITRDYIQAGVFALPPAK